MTREKFLDNISTYYEEYRANWSRKSQETIICHAYDIAKYQMITEYLQYLLSFAVDDTNDVDDLDRDAYIILHDNIISKLDDNCRFDLTKSIYDFELNYDYPMWTTYENISQIIIDYKDELSIDNTPYDITKEEEYLYY